MPILLTINVTDPAGAIASGYDVIKVYRSSYEDGGYTEVSTAITRPTLDANTYYYDFEDSTGTPSSWYKTSYYDTSTGSESSLSSASRGIEVTRQYLNVTYDTDITLTPTDHFNIDRIRFYIGDEKKVVHEYVSPNCTNGYQYVSDDGYTYKLQSRGWPLYVEKDGTEYTSSSNPYVTDYTYITFSGTQISTTSGILDIWYESFRHSDREILDVFIHTPDPAGVPSSSVTTEMLRLKASIDLLRSEVTALMGETSGSFTLTDEMSYNPEPLLRQKRALIGELEKRLKELTDDAVRSTITGVRVE